MRCDCSSVVEGDGILLPALATWTLGAASHQTEDYGRQPQSSGQQVSWQPARVKTRLFINALNEQFWLVDLPAFECLDGA